MNPVLTESIPASCGEKAFRLTPRLAALQETCRVRSTTFPLWRRGGNEAYAFNELYAGLPLRLRQACSLAYALTHEPVFVFPGEDVQGMFYPCGVRQQPFYTEPKEDAAGAEAYQQRIEALPGWKELMGRGLPDEARTEIISAGGFPGHIAWNWDKLLALGVEGMIAEHRTALASSSAAGDTKAEEFHRCEIIALQAMLDWNRRHVQALRETLNSVADEEMRAQVEECIAIMERVPAKPARNFREAVQSYHFQWTCVMYESPFGGNSPGRLDYLLWPYLRAEYEAGTITDEAATELIAELFLKCDERVHPSDGHVNAIVIGGVAPDGTDAVSPLTYLMIDAISALNLTHPSIYTRIHGVNPPAYVRKAVEYLLRGSNRGQILNDEALIAAMTRDGQMPFADAARYICGGCMEINPQGLNSDLIWSFHYNVSKTLELCLTGGMDLRTGAQRLNPGRSLREMQTFDELYDFFLDAVRRTLLLKFRELDICSERYAAERPQFLISSMTDDCLARGRDLQDGGARYHDYGGSPLGIPNAADSLLAIKHAVFDTKFCTAEELLAALAADFAGYEPLRQRLLALPKYGQGNLEADALMRRLVADISQIFSSYRNRFGGVVKQVILTFTFGASHGDNLGASADGRRSRQPVAHGLTPQSSAQTCGLTAAIASYASLDNELISGGSSTMWDMDPEWVSQELLEAVVRTFLQQGGQIFQGNMTSVAELEAALREPEQYRHLIVRVGGFSARFVTLSPVVQRDVIGRLRHRR